MKHSPAHYAQALHDVFEKTSDSARPEILGNFLKVLEKNHDGRLLPRILSRYEKIFLNTRNLKKIDVEAASILAPAVRKEIEEKAGGNILLTESVNPSLIGGLVITVNDTVRVDASVRSRLAKLFA